MIGQFAVVDASTVALLVNLSRYCQALKQMFYLTST